MAATQYGAATVGTPATASCAGWLRPQELWAPTAYLVLYTVYDILCARSSKVSGGYYRFEPAVMVLAIELGKWVLSAVLLLLSGPGELPPLGAVARNAKALSTVAFCFAVLNTLNLVCLSKVSLSSYSLWFQTSIIFNAIFWYFMFNKTCGTRKMVALALLTTGCCLNTIHPGGVVHVDAYVPLVLLSALLSALGCVLNEYFVKREASIDLNVMNLILYFETSVVLCVLILGISWHRGAPLSHMFKGFEGDCWVIAGVSICLGLSVSRILKYSSAMAKNFVMAVHCPLEVFCAHRIIGTEFTGYTTLSALLIGVATYQYYVAPSEKKPSSELPS